ncbi:hypothetical protein CKA81_11295 [Pollutimonas thiosulfatoxidans]|uniref:Uncharacterized protein n=2 Tax=Pollutimonas thiosulfatoxidans TaxID=2028345 RepID=A0A410GDH6_9BURK|nr:hypothetical protein CKA81_11295 [Pollutimonas thiosulfatoxidans]
MTSFAIPAKRVWPAAMLAVLVFASIFYASGIVAGWPANGRVLAFALLAGTAFGVVLQRSRFCFFCVTRDFLDQNDSRGLIGIVVALAVGTIGYHVLFSAFLPIPAVGRLPPGAHIGPISWVLVLGSLAFGVGMAVSGSCISAHLYRLGEGSVASIFALLGALVGFALGFASWNTLYLLTIQEAPIVWLPHSLGYGWSLLAQLAALALVAAFLLKRHDGTKHASEPAGTFQWADVFVRRWPTWAGGLLVAFIGVMSYFRYAPLGVTAELGSVARTAASQWQLLPDRLEGLDTFSGCATVVKETLLSPNGLFVLGLIGGAWAAALVAGEFKPRLPSLRDVLRNFGGGVLMGWGAMLALGCTVGTLLSGIMAGALSGWVFAIACVLGVWGGWRLRQKVAAF